MFGWFRKETDQLLEFPDNRAAFDYACANLPNRVLLEAVIPALVEGVGRRGWDGERYYTIRLAGPDGGRILSACTLAEAPGWPEVGDLVGFKVVMTMEDMGPEAEPLGFISVVLAPVWVGRKGWRIARNLTPDNIKPTIRF